MKAPERPGKLERSSACERLAMEIGVLPAIKRIGSASALVGKVPRWRLGVASSQKSFAKNPIIAIRGSTSAGSM